MKRRTLFLLLLIPLAILIPSGAVLAGAPFDTVVQAGETHDDDIVILDGDLNVQAGATVNGDITVFSGDVTIAGTVNGDVVLFDGDLDAETTAVINGECVIMSGDLTDATPNGLICTNFDTLESLPNTIPPIDGISGIEFSDYEPSGTARFLGRVGGAIFQSILLGLIAFAVATLFPNQFNRVENSVRHKPVASGTVGFLTSFAVPVLLLIASPLLAVLALVCGLGILLTLAVVLGMAGAIAFGWFVVGNIVGVRIADRFNMQNRTLPVTTAVGTAALTLGLGLLGAVPFFFGIELIGFVIACIGLGSVVLTKFGTRAYPPLVSDSIQILDQPENDEKIANAIKTLPDDDNTLS